MRFVTTPSGLIGSKTIGSQTLGEKGERAEITVGIPWEPAEFVRRAAGLGHPKLFLKAIPREMDDVNSHYLVLESFRAWKNEN